MQPEGVVQPEGVRARGRWPARAKVGHHLIAVSCMHIGYVDIRLREDGLADGFPSR